MNAQNKNRMLYLTIFILSLVEFLQSSMTAFAAGPIMGEVSISPEDFSLIASAYASGAILAISMQRWFIERIGGRRYIQASSTLFVVGTVLCALSNDFNSFLIGRVITSLGCGALFTSSRMIIHHLLAAQNRFIGIKSLATGVSLGIAVSPWLASVAVSHETWSAIYWMLSGVGVLAFVLASFSLSVEPVKISGEKSEFEFLQQVLLVGGSFGLLYSLQRFYYDFYGDFAIIALELVASILALYFYLRHQKRSTHPLLRVSEMLSVRYLSGLALFAFAYIMLGANNYVVPLMLQKTMGYSWETVGNFEALGLSVAFVTWIIASKALQHYPAPKKFLIVGFTSLALFGGLLTQVNTAANFWADILPALAFNSVFLLMVLPITAMQTFRELDQNDSVFTNAQQLKNMMSQVGISLGITLATVGQQWRTTVHYSTLNSQMTPDNPIYQETMHQLQSALAPSLDAAQSAQAATAQLAQMLAQQSAMLANIDHFAVISILGVLGVLVTLAQRVFR